MWLCWLIGHRYTLKETLKVVVMPYCQRCGKKAEGAE